MLQFKEAEFQWRKVGSFSWVSWDGLAEIVPKISHLTTLWSLSVLRSIIGRSSRPLRCETTFVFIKRSGKRSKQPSSRSFGLLKLHLCHCWWCLDSQISRSWLRTSNTLGSEFVPTKQVFMVIESSQRLQVKSTLLLTSDISMNSACCSMSRRHFGRTDDNGGLRAWHENSPVEGRNKYCVRTEGLSSPAQA